MTEDTWETTEAHLQIANDKGLYAIMLTCWSVESLERRLKRLISDVDVDAVNWQTIFDDFEDDREGAKQ